MGYIQIHPHTVFMDVDSSYGEQNCYLYQPVNMFIPPDKLEILTTESVPSGHSRNCTYLIIIYMMFNGLDVALWLQHFSYFS